MRAKVAIFTLLCLISLSVFPLSVISVHAQTNGYKLLFSNRNIFTINVDGTDLTQLTSGSITKSNPTWSADGAYIAYVYNPEGIGAAPGHVAYRRSEDLNQLWVMNSDGSNQQLIASRSSRFQWSPIDHRIAYFDGTFVNSDQSGLWVLDLATQQRIKITDVGDLGFAWSPDGKFLVTTTGVMGHGPDTFFNGVILDIIDSETTEGTYSQQIECADCIPVWSPDGSHIMLKNQQTVMLLTNTGKLIFQIDGSDPMWAFHSHKVALINGQNLEVIELEEPSIRVRRLSDKALFRPVWSPDNTKIIFIGPNNLDSSDYWRFYLVTRVEDERGNWNSAHTFIYSSAVGYGEGTFPLPVSWSTDSRYVAMEHSMEGGSKGITVFDFSTGEQTLLLPQQPAYDISWQPLN
ncbi:MAG: hypothetical protein U0528_16880 [Anaerolineae bacterium]|nr:PD40 domain-containing protein [Anaerolineae bacterium]